MDPRKKGFHSPLCRVVCPQMQNHPHEIEELEFAPQSEELNCLSEAGDVCRSLGIAPVVAPFVVNVFAPYYCRSTDAFAGTYLGTSKGFATESEARAYLDGLYYNDELSYQLVSGGVSVNTAPASANNEDCPF